jgi:hypothetical protein
VPLLEHLKGEKKMTEKCWGCDNPLDGGSTVGCPGCGPDAKQPPKTMDDQILDEIARRDIDCPCKGKGYTTVVGGVTVTCPRHRDANADTNPLMHQLRDIYNRITKD